MKTRNKKECHTSVAEEEVGLNTSAKNADTIGMESIGVLTRSQKKRLSAVGARTHSAQASKEPQQSIVRKKNASSNYTSERNENEEQNSDTQSLKNVSTQDSTPLAKSIVSKRRSTRIQQSINKEDEDKHNESSVVEVAARNNSDSISGSGKKPKRELFSGLGSKESDAICGNKNLSDVEEIEVSEVIADVKDLQKSNYDDCKHNKSENVDRQNENLSEPIDNRKNKLPNKNYEKAQKHGSDGSSSRKKPRTSKEENVKPNLMKNVSIIEESALIKHNDSDDGSVLMSSQLTDTSDNTKGSESCEIILKTPLEYDKVSSKSTKTSKESGSLLQQSYNKNDSERKPNKKNYQIKDKTTHLAFQSSSLTDGSSEGNMLTYHSGDMPFKEPELKISKNSEHTDIDKQNKSYNSKGSNSSKLDSKKELNTFGRYEMKSPTTEKRKSLSSKDDGNETSESDSDAESRKAIMESAHKRIIQNISTSESESRKAMPPVKILQNLKISSDSDSGPESIGFNVARQQAKDSLKQAVESIQREKKRRKEKRKQRLEKYKQQKEEKLIRLKEKRASQEDASCSSSEESAYEEDEAVIAPSLSKSVKTPTVTKEKENIDDLLPSKRRKTDDNNKAEEKKSIKEAKNDLSEDQEQQPPYIGKLKMLTDEILENLPDTPPINLGKHHEKIPFYKKKNKTERQKNNKNHKGSEVIRGMQDIDYIPLSTYGATEFGAIPLNKMMRAPKSMAQQAAEFRHQRFYGSHIKRVSGNSNVIYQQKLKAAGKNRLVR